MNRWLDRLITLVLLALLGWGGASLVHWLLIGADWSVVTTNLPLYALGSYPPDQRWRPLVWISALILLILFTLLGPRHGVLRRALPLVWIGMAPAGLWLLAGGLTTSSTAGSTSAKESKEELLNLSLPPTCSCVPRVLLCILLCLSCCQEGAREAAACHLQLRLFFRTRWRLLLLRAAWLCPLACWMVVGAQSGGIGLSEARF